MSLAGPLASGHVVHHTFPQIAVASIMPSKRQKTAHISMKLRLAPRPPHDRPCLSPPHLTSLKRDPTLALQTRFLTLLALLLPYLSMRNPPHRTSVLQLRLSSSKIPSQMACHHRFPQKNQRRLVHPLRLTCQSRVCPRHAQRHHTLIVHPNHSHAPIRGCRTLRRTVTRTRSQCGGGQSGYAAAAKDRIEVAKFRCAPPTDVLLLQNLILFSHSAGWPDEPPRIILSLLPFCFFLSCSNHEL